MAPEDLMSPGDGWARLERIAGGVRADSTIVLWEQADAMLAERGRLRAALELIITWNRQEAHDRYGDRERAESWACVREAMAALADPAAG